VALESSSNSVRSVAARSVAVGLVAELQAARILNSGPVDVDNTVCDQARAGLARADDSGANGESGGTHIWEHLLWEVSDEYGDEVRYFERLTMAAEVYRAWAVDRGL
jgi:hypothetical protein